MSKKNKKIETLTQELVMPKADQLTYQGSVSFQVLHGNKVISTKRYSNSGLPDLFRYICYALAGNYATALRPCKIALFYCDQGGNYEYPSAFDWQKAYGKGLMDISPYVVYDATPVVKSTKTGYSTTFRFKIPYNWLYKKSFNVIGLFTENKTACAYYLCTTEGVNPSEPDKTIKVWDPVILDDITGNFSLIVEWTMEVSNKG